MVVIIGRSARVDQGAGRGGSLALVGAVCIKMAIRFELGLVKLRKVTLEQF